MKRTAVIVALMAWLPAVAHAEVLEVKQKIFGMD